MAGILDIEAGRAAVCAAAASLTGISGSVFAVASTELGPFFRQVDDLSRQLEAARVAILAEALTRGVVAQSDCPSAASWVIHWGPSYRAGGAAQLVAVAHGVNASSAVRNIGLAAAVLGARVGVRNAAVVLEQMGRLRPRLRDQAVEAVWAGFIQIATDHGPRQIRSLREKIIATYGRSGEFERRDAQLKHGVSLSQSVDDDGMAVYRLRLDPEGREVLEAILGPLSAPKPTSAGADLRSSDQRRGEALVAICRRAAAAGGAAPATTKAAVYVTITLADLQAQTGAGTCLGTGRLLAPGTIRRMACDATIIPVVLGAGSEVLDIGRARRLFPPGILHAMWLRDKGCTIPGCGAPPFWADAHHLTHWVDGGPTSLTNAALLCGRHHTIAHQRGWTATATTSEVTWHL